MAVLERCSEPDVAALHRGNWFGREQEAGQLLARVLPRATDAMESVSFILAAEQYKLHALADATLARLLTERPGDYDVLIAQVTLALRRGEDAARRESHARALVAANPDRLQGWVFLTRTLVERESPHAERTCERALAAFPHHPVLLWLHGEALLLRQETEAADALFRRAVETEPGLTAAWERLLERVGDPSLVLPMLQTATTADPFYTPLALRYAGLLLQAGAPEEVDRVLLPCVGDAWRQPALYRPLAAAARAVGRFADAAIYYRVAAFLGDAGAHLDRAECLLQAHEPARAGGEALAGWFRSGEAAPAADRAWAIVEAVHRGGPQQPDRGAFADWLWRDGPKPAATNGTDRARRAELAEDWTVAAEHRLPDPRTAAATTFEDRLAAVAALAWSTTPTSERVWTLAAESVAALREAANRAGGPNVALHLEAQMWTGQAPLVEEFGRVLADERAGKTATGIDAKILRVAQELIKIRDDTRPN
jgi:tetratricopeptide (TPR) repeat protein